jgi:flavin-dependent dehydrogenase
MPIQRDKLKTIKILGGGIAGLTAAINLRRAGIDVEVHERKQFCGKHTNDFQFLENWTFEEDVLDILKSINIRINFYTKSWYSQEILSPSLKSYFGKSSTPLMYLIKRGQAEDSLDCSLEKQAHHANAKIIFESDLRQDDADIIATGIKKPTAIASGIKFGLNHPDKTLVLLDDNLAFKWYAYFIVNDNIAEIVSINPVEIKDQKERLDRTVRRFEEFLKIKVDPGSERFSAPANIYYLENASINNQLFVGEAAGFQDCLAGFGMNYAFKSGYYAAQSIIEKRNYDELWKNDLLKPMEVSSRNRYLYEKLSNRGYERAIQLISSNNFIIMRILGGKDMGRIMKKIYNRCFPNLLRPFVTWFN